MGARINRRTVVKLFSGTLLSSQGSAKAAKKDRVVIVGAGIMGASIAYHLAKRGAKVTVLEKQRPGCGATEKSFAWINASFSKQPRSYFELNFLGLAGWRRLTEEIGSELKVQWGGSVQWFKPGDPAGAQLADKVYAHERWGYGTYMIDEPELIRLVPSIHPGPVGAACHSGMEGTVDPVQALDTLLKHAQRLGAHIECPCEVRAILLQGDRVRAIETSKGSMEADCLVLAAGVDTSNLARMVDVRVPLKESAGLLAHTTPQPRLLDRVVMAPGTNIKQNPDGRIVTGSDFEDAATIDTSREFGMKLLRNAEQYLTHMKGAALQNVTLGHRVLPVDGHPIVGFPRRCPNLYIAAMHSGITLSPLIGQLAAMEILDGVNVDLLDPFRPQRFS